jgi:hypothetical protein
MKVNLSRSFNVIEAPAATSPATLAGRVRCAAAFALSNTLRASVQNARRAGATKTAR